MSRTHPSPRTTDRKRLLVVGSGFAGVWAALSAARRRRELHLDDELDITVMSPEPFLGVRPRYYEPDLDTTRIELEHLLAPVGVEHLRARALSVDTAAKVVRTEAGPVPYDALVWAAGSALVRPDVPGAEHLFTVDTFDDAAALDEHLRSLAGCADDAARTIVVVGAGFTGLEIAAEMRDRMRTVVGDAHGRVVLVERAPRIAPEFGSEARAVIERALAELDVEIRTGASVASVDADAVHLDDGTRLASSTVIWSGGVRAAAVTASIAAPADAQGRLAVDEDLRVTGTDDVWAAGDVARALVDGENLALMSCQHATPQGRYAGHNAVSALAGRTPRRYRQHLYSTCLDLGGWGALLTSGFDRDHVVATGQDAKELKRYINRSVIYPPLGDADALLKAAELPNGGRVAAAATAKLLANPTARSLGIRRAHDGPSDLLARREAAGG